MQRLYTCNVFYEQRTTNLDVTCNVSTVVVIAMLLNGDIAVNSGTKKPPWTVNYCEEG